MRLLLSALFGMLFLAAFVGYFLMQSITGYVDSPERLVRSANESGMREAIIEQTAEYIADEVAKDPTLETMSASELEGIVGGVITKKWLDDSLRLAHGAIKSAIHGAEGTAVLDLREVKAALRTALSRLKEGAREHCVGLWGPDVCSDAKASEMLMAAFETRALLAIGELHDEIDLLEEVQGADREDAAQLHEGLESMETVKMLALVALVLSLASFIAFNNRPLSRLCMSVGGLAFLSSVIYLIVIEVSESMATDEVTRQTHGEVEPGTVTLGAELANRVVSDAVSGSTLPVTMIGLAGVALVVAGYVLRPRTTVRPI